jgi:fermentation-respiration switch protein FrsA (DUF1100 family)
MIAALLLAAAVAPPAFDYDASAPLHLAVSAQHARDGISLRDVRFSSEGGRTVKGTFVDGRGAGPHPAVLFVHWLGETPETTNRTEFEPDALALAKRGVTSLCIDAMWASPDWFERGRTTDADYRNSIDQVVDLRRSLDALLAQSNVDASRVAYVGHDFGSMYGALLAGVDPRPRWYVLMAGTTTFAQWYLLGAQPADVQAYMERMAPLDPLASLGRSQAKAFFFQFSAHDKYITPEHERAFFEAAPLPRAMAVYDADHALAVPEAFADRQAWLAEHLLAP